MIVVVVVVVRSI